jgi:hypothetical protein
MYWAGILAPTVAHRNLISQSIERQTLEDKHYIFWPVERLTLSALAH